MSGLYKKTAERISQQFFCSIFILMCSENPSLQIQRAIKQTLR